MALLIRLLFDLVFEIPILRFIALAVAPALLLLRYVRNKDAIEAEPPKLIWSLVGLGILSTGIAYVLEIGGLAVLQLLFAEENLLFQIIRWIVVVGLMEEVSKYLMLRLRTWKNPNFNCLFDGMVYAVAVSAGFALAENILYGVMYGTGVLLIRAVVSIPAHLCFSVFMGTWYSVAKRFAAKGDERSARKCLALSVAVSAIAHGLFDLLADYAGSVGMLVLMAAYVIAMFIVCWRIVKYMSERDAYLTGGPGGFAAPDEQAPIPGPVPTLPDNVPPTGRDRIG